ncbi:MAG: SH3 domain-containing protein, partial [Lachnospiraceae bacterium]|nr:SH3 domain-containing protein [Lachnospiraceae bacterium]
MKMSERVHGKMKWGIALAALLMFYLIFMTDGLALTGHAASEGKIKAASANIRQEASASSTAVGSALKGSKVEILGQTTGADGKVWYQIRVDANVTGYIRSDLVEITDGSTPDSNGGNAGAVDTSAGGEAEAVVPVSATVSGSNTVRVRTSATTGNSNNILTTINNGTAVTVVARTTGADNKLWYQVKFTSNGNDVIGYIRSDYLTISGDVTPLSEETVQQPEEQNEENVEEKPAPVQEQTKRYETKLIGESWYILDYEEGVQYEVAQLLTAADKFKALYETEKSKVKSKNIFLLLLGIFALFLIAAAIYLIYRLKEYKEEAFIASIENNTVNRGRTAERPRNPEREVTHTVGRERPASREGMESGRPDRAQGQSAARPAQGQSAARPAQGQSAARPAQGQSSARPAQGQSAARPTQG